MARPTIFVSIGNSDDRLTQSRWADYYREVDSAIREATGEIGTIHGAWVSEPTTPYQNACWAFTIDIHGHLWDGADGERQALREALQEIARYFDQDTVAWAEAVTEFLPGGRKPVEPSPAEQRIAVARTALIETGYFTEDEVGDDIAPRIIELAAAFLAGDRPS